MSLGDRRLSALIATIITIYYYFLIPRRVECLGSPKERLRDEIIRNLDLTVGPEIGNPRWAPIYIYIHLRILQLALNVDNSELSLTGIAVMEWNDKQLVWNPANYDGIKTINLKGVQSWNPNVVLLNPVEHKTYSRPFKPIGDLLVTNNGFVSLPASVNLHSVCDLNFQNWPWDTHNCKIQLSIWAQNVSLAPVAIWRQNIVSEWQIQSDNERYSVSGIAKMMEYTYTNFANTNMNGYHYYPEEIELVLMRKTSFYHNLLFYLFIVMSLLLLLTVCASPLSTRKIVFNCFYILLVTTISILTANSLPDFTRQTPTIVMAYCIMFVIASLYAAVCVFLIALIRTKQESSPPQCVVAILNNVLLATICSLPKETIQENESYRSRTSGNHRGNINTNLSAITKSNGNWLKLASVIDNTFSIFILILTIFLFDSF